MKVAATIFFLSICMVASSQSFDASIFSSLNFRFIGPDGNRMIAVAGEPGNPMVSYAGAASGGLWKTEDMGITWKPIFDKTDDSSIGAISISPSNPNQVWVGTGETFLIRPAHAVGNGVYKSSNGGKTWNHLGLEKTFRISKVIVHPTDTNIVYVAALGHAHGPQQERGVYKTIDGGKTWERIFFVNENTGCSDLSIDPKNPSVLFAAMWEIEIKTWNLKSGGAGSGIYRSKDGGKTWQPLRNGIESGSAHPVGKTSVDVAFTNPNVVYALVEDQEPRLYKSEDGGDSWKLMQKDHSMGQRAGYYTRVRVSTGNENVLYTICVGIMKSTDGGKTFDKKFNQWAPGGDNHDMWFDPKNPNRILCAHDGCLNMTFNEGKSWKNINLPIAQLYHIAVDDQIPYYVYSNRQDAWSYRGPSRYLAGGSIPLGAWHGVGGCESGFAQPDPFDNTIVWSGCYDGGLDVFDLKTMRARDVRVWPQTQIGAKPADAKYRWHWNFPMVVSKHIKGSVWVGSQFVHETNSMGQQWNVISPDLTTNEKSHQQNSGGMASDNLMTWDGCTLYSMAESPVKQGVLWTGSNDGQVNVTQDGGKTWKNVTLNISGLPKWATIRNIDASNFNAGTVYLSADAHTLGDFSPYVFKTIDFGNTWTRIQVKLPESNSNYVNQIKEDPEKQGLLWLGTDKGLYFSPDDGINWMRLKNNLPPVPIYGIEIQKRFNDLVLATYGRGVYILDDITPIREFTESIQANQAHLFSINDSYRFQPINGIKTESSFVSGENPPEGAAITYYLKDKSKDSVEIQIFANNNQLIKKIKGVNNKGIHRVWWDYRLQAYELPKLLNKPRGKDWVKVDSLGNRTMFVFDLDIGPGLTPPKAPVGNYKVILKVNGKEFVQGLTLLKDPATTSNPEMINKQYAFGTKLYNSIKNTLSLIDEMERTRLLLNKRINDKTASAIEDKVYNMEAALHDVNQTGARMDIFRNAPQVLERFLAISKESQIFSGDTPPTDQQQEVFELTQKRLEEIQSQFELIKKNPQIKKLESKK